MWLTEEGISSSQLPNLKWFPEWWSHSRLLGQGKSSPPFLLAIAARVSPLGLPVCHNGGTWHHLGHLQV